MKKLKRDDRMAQHKGLPDMTEDEKVTLLKSRLAYVCKGLKNREWQSAVSDVSAFVNFLYDCKLPEKIRLRFIRKLHEQSGPFREQVKEQIYITARRTPQQIKEKAQPEYEILIRRKPMINEQRKQVAFELLGVDKVDESTRDEIDLCLENAVHAAKNEDFDLLSGNLINLADVLGAGKLEKNDQKLLIEKLGIVVKTLCGPNGQPKMLKEYFKWNAWAEPIKRPAKISKSDFLWREK